MLRVIDRIGSLQFDPLEVAGRNHDLVLLARIAGYRREWTDHWLYEDRRLYETYNKSLNIVPVAELPLYRWTWDRMRDPARRRRVRRPRAARRGAPRADPGRRRAAPARRRRARGDRLVLAPDQPGPGDPRGPRGGRDHRHRPARGQPPRLRPRGAALSRRRCSPRSDARRGAAAAPPPLPLPGQRPAGRVGQPGAVGRRHGLRGGSRGPCGRRSSRRAGCSRSRSRACRASASSSPRTSRSSTRPKPRSRADRSPGGVDAGVAFLAPLDPLCWDRDLLRRLFDFDYVWEVYVPAPKRRWGYYVLPILYGDRLVGRIEPRIERRAGTLRIAGLWWEPGFDPARRGWASSRRSRTPSSAHRDFADLGPSTLPREARHRPLVTAVRGALDGAAARSAAPCGTMCERLRGAGTTRSRTPARRLPMAETRHATATWSGNLTEGSGMLQYISSGAFSRMPITWDSRTAAHEGRTSPEELLAAAHASCFSMAFANQLAKNGTVAERLDVRVDVTADKRDAGWTVLSSAIKVSGRRPGHRRRDVREDRRRRQGRLPDLARPRRQRRAVGRAHAPRRVDSRPCSPAGARFVYRRRRWLVAARARRRRRRSASLAGGTADHLTTGGWLDPTSESAAGLRPARGRVRRRAVGVHRPVPSRPTPGADATSAEFQAAIAATLAPVLEVEGVTGRDRLRGDAATTDSSARRATPPTS